MGAVWVCANDHTNPAPVAVERWYGRKVIATLGWTDKNAIFALPSTRPESDFTLDVPRAEQLRLKMKKEKQFRSRCRWFFYFLSVVFFLLSVMVVSLILTRGKRMFGSMI
uniref:Uncharacterized protein n=1 Tax=Anopheles minimus TaxID=112268 RepID=A0A182WB92_9DIPT